MSIKQLFCGHDYIKIDQIEVKSEFEIVSEQGYTPNTWNSPQRTVITHFKCNKCKKLKIICQ